MQEAQKKTYSVNDSSSTATLAADISLAVAVVDVTAGSAWGDLQLKDGKELGYDLLNQQVELVP